MIWLNILNVYILYVIFEFNGFSFLYLYYIILLLYLFSTTYNFKIFHRNSELAEIFQFGGQTEIRQKKKKKKIQLKESLYWYHGCSSLYVHQPRLLGKIRKHNSHRKLLDSYNKKKRSSWEVDVAAKSAKTRENRSSWEKREKKKKNMRQRYMLL